MYRLNVHIPNATSILSRTFNFATRSEADYVQQYAMDKGLSSMLRPAAIDSVAEAIQQIDEELNLAAESRIA